MTYAHTRMRRLGAVGVALVAITAAVTIPAAAIPSHSPGPRSAAADSGQSPAVRTPLGSSSSASQLPKQRQGAVPGEILLTLDANTSVTGRALAGTRMAARVPQTNNAALNTALHAAGATSLLPVLPSSAQASASSSATSQLRSSVSDVPRTYVVRIHAKDSAAVARTLDGTSGVAYAEPNRYVNTMNTGAQPLSSTAVRAATVAAAACSQGPFRVDGRDTDQLRPGLLRPGAAQRRRGQRGGRLHHPAEASSGRSPAPARSSPTCPSAT